MKRARNHTSKESPFQLMNYSSCLIPWSLLPTASSLQLLYLLKAAGVVAQGGQFCLSCSSLRTHAGLPSTLPFTMPPDKRACGPTSSLWASFLCTHCLAFLTHVGMGFGNFLLMRFTCDACSSTHGFRPHRDSAPQNL